MQTFMYSQGSTQGPQPPDFYASPDLDRDERALQMIEYMLPHLKNFSDPTLWRTGAQFIFFQRPHTWMAIEDVLQLVEYLLQKRIIEACSMQLSDQALRYIVFTNTNLDDLTAKLNDFSVKGRRLDGPIR